MGTRTVGFSHPITVGTNSWWETRISIGRRDSHSGRQLSQPIRPDRRESLDAVVS